MPTNVIFCLSYLNLPQTLVLCEEEPDSVVITHNRQVAKFFRYYGLAVEVKLIESPSPFLSRNFFADTYKIFKLKRRYWRELKSLSASSVYFGFISYCYMEAWLIKKLSRKNKIIWFGEVSLNSQSCSFSIKCRLDIILAKLMFGIDLTPVKQTTSRQYSLSESFFNSLKLHKIKVDLKNVQNYLSKFFKAKLEIPEDAVILLTGGVVESKLMSESSYPALLREIINFSIERQIFAKPHPRFEKTDSALRIFKAIPAFIPANLLFGGTRIVVGFCSATLFEAANLGYLSISLLELCEVEPSEKAFQRNYLDSNCMDNSSILYPESIPELILLLKDQS